MSANWGVYLGTFVQTFGKKYYVGHNFKSLSCEVIWILALLPGVVLSQTAGPWQPMPKQLRYLHLQYARCWLWDPAAYKLNKRVSKSWLAGQNQPTKGSNQAQWMELQRFRLHLLAFSCILHQEALGCKKRSHPKSRMIYLRELLSVLLSVLQRPFCHTTEVGRLIWEAVPTHFCFMTVMFLYNYSKPTGKLSYIVEVSLMFFRKAEKMRTWWW